MTTTSSIERVPLAEAAAILGVANSTLRRWTKLKRITCYRVGKIITYSTLELERIKRENPCEEAQADFAALQEQTNPPVAAPNSTLPRIQDVSGCPGCGNLYLSKGADGYWKCNVCGKCSTDA